jgi:hypothetical protein
LKGKTERPCSNVKCNSFVAVLWESLHHAVDRNSFAGTCYELPPQYPR